MLNLYSKPKETNHQLEIKLFNQSFIISYKFYSKDDDLFIDEIFYFSDQENFLVNAYLNLLKNRALDVLDRVSVKEFDYFLREDNSKPYFNKISKELLELIGLGERLKSKHKKAKKTLESVYNEDLHGPIEFMSLGELLELIEEILSHESLNKYNLTCSNIENYIVYLSCSDEIKPSDKSYIESIIKKLGHNRLKVDL